MTKVKVPLSQLARKGLIPLFIKDFNLKVGLSAQDIRAFFLFCDYYQEHIEEFYLHITEEQRKIITPFICEFGIDLKYRKEFKVRILQELTAEEIEENFDFIAKWRNRPTKPQWQKLMKSAPKAKTKIQAYLRENYK